MGMRDLRAAMLEAQRRAATRAYGQVDEAARLAIAQREAQALAKGARCSECRRSQDRRELDDSGRCHECSP